MDDAKIDLTEVPVHLGLGAKVTVQEPFTDMSWYERYAARVAADGAEGRLVGIHTFSEPWSNWEVHPEGHELVVCLAGRITIHQEMEGGVRSVVLEPYEAAINPPGVWHTADVDRETTTLFITAGKGTQHRPRT